MSVLSGGLSGPDRVSAWCEWDRGGAVVHVCGGGDV